MTSAPIFTELWIHLLYLIAIVKHNQYLITFCNKNNFSKVKVYPDLTHESYFVQYCKAKTQCMQLSYTRYYGSNVYLESICYLCIADGLLQVCQLDSGLYSGNFFSREICLT